jgi:hypothetical protein
MLVLVDRDVFDDDEDEEDAKLEGCELDKIFSRSSAEAPQTKTVLIRRFDLELFS